MAALPPRFRPDLTRAPAIELPADYDDLTPSERIEVRDRYVEEQDGACHHCEWSLDGPPAPEIDELPINWNRFPGERSFLKYPVHLHHCHDSGMTIGAVHAKCNAVLWQYHGE